MQKLWVELFTYMGINNVEWVLQLDPNTKPKCTQSKINLNIGQEKFLNNSYIIINEKNIYISVFTFVAQLQCFRS